MSDRTVKLHAAVPKEFQYDKSFIVILDRMKEQKFKAVRASDPSVENPVVDGYKQGHYDCIREVIEAFKVYG